MKEEKKRNIIESIQVKKGVAIQSLKRKILMEWWSIMTNRKRKLDELD
jgi:hypothetical protein